MIVSALEPCTECRSMAFAHCTKCGAPVCDMACAALHQKRHAPRAIRRALAREAEDREPED